MTVPVAMVRAAITFSTMRERHPATTCRGNGATIHNAPAVAKAQAEDYCRLKGGADEYSHRKNTQGRLDAD